MVGFLGYFGISPFSKNAEVVIGAQPQQLVSSNSRGAAANGDSGRPSMDPSGRYVAFTSAATNLANAAKGHKYNIYRKDRNTGEIYLASGGLDNSAGNGDSQFPIICGKTGRYIAFASTSTNLVAGASRLTGSFYRIYVRDTLSNQTSLVSLSGDGVEANDDSRNPHFNDDCSKIVFESAADNLVPGDKNRVYDVFVRDLHAQATIMASVNYAGETLDGGGTYADINASGTVVAFTSWPSSSNGEVVGRPEVYLRELQTRRTIAISPRYSKVGTDVQGFSWPSFSPDGRYLIFRSVTNPLDPSQRGRHVLVWDVLKEASAITAADGTTPTGWDDACITGVNNGTNFSPVMSNPTGSHPYRVLFTVDRDGVCNLVLRNIDGNNVPIKSEINFTQILEPTINSTGDFLSWAVASQPQQIYACEVNKCKGSPS